VTTRSLLWRIKALEAENKKLKAQLQTQATLAVEPTTTSARQLRPDYRSVVRSKPPIWSHMPYGTPLIPSQTAIKRGPRTPSTEPVLKSSRVDTAEDRECEAGCSVIRCITRISLSKIWRIVGEWMLITA